MEVNIKELSGSWDRGFAMDKHSKYSVMTGHNEYGHPIYDTTRTEVGEAVFQLKYRSDWTQVQPLAECLYKEAYPLFQKVGFILPMPASNARERQHVTEIAEALAKLSSVPCFSELLLKAPGGAPLKDLKTKEEKVKAIGDSFSVSPIITNDGCWNVLLIDDLYHTGASMEAACGVLRRYNKVNKIYVASLTWR